MTAINVQFPTARDSTVISRSLSHRNDKSVVRGRPLSHLDPSLYSSSRRLPRKNGNRLARLLLVNLHEQRPHPIDILSPLEST